MDEKIVEFRIPQRSQTEENDPPGRLGRAPAPACPHPKYILDKHQRTVKCGACGQWLDPVWCLLRLLEHDESIERRIAHLEALERAAKARQERAIARKQKDQTRAELQKAAENCQACGGTGWAPHPSGGVQKCECRKRLAQAYLV